MTKVETPRDSPEELTMRVLFLTLALGAALVTALPSSEGEDPAWEAFKSKYKKTYESPDDENSRHALFTVAQYRVKQLNALNGRAGALPPPTPPMLPNTINKMTFALSSSHGRARQR